MAQSPEWLAIALLDPAAYPWRPPEVERIDTHVSHVFLAGDRVVKIKRPVDLGFVDLRDAAARHRACVAEDSLNRRLTHDLYLGVVPVTASGGRARVDGPGEPVEYAVVMRRLPGDRMLDRLIATRSVPAGTADSIAERLIPFHRSAQQCGPSDPRRCADAQARVLRENVEQMLALPRPCSSALITEQTGEAVLNGIGVLSSLLRARCEDGWVRDGHGDLRADHICLEPGRLQVFDCIEFDPGLRCADVASDLAFLLMDLHRLGAHDLSAGLLARYHDAGILLPHPLIRLYTAHRALVRVKVGLIEQGQGVGGPLDQPIANHLDAAAAAVFTVDPALIAVSGPSGTGKSVVAARIGRAFGIEVIQSDALRQRIEPNPDPAIRYRADRVAAVYAEMRREAAAVIGQGRAVVLDATFLDTRERELAAAAAAEAGVPFLLVEVTASDATAHRRIARRAADATTLSDADTAVYLRQRVRMAANPARVPDGAILVRIDNDEDIPPPIDPVFAALEGAGILHEALLR